MYKNVFVTSIRRTIGMVFSFGLILRTNYINTNIIISLNLYYYCTIYMLWKDQNYETIVATFTVTLRFGIIVNHIYLTTTTIRLLKVLRML